LFEGLDELVYTVVFLADVEFDFKDSVVLTDEFLETAAKD